MKISVQLSFNGQCEEAFALYARLLDGTVVYSLRYRDSPMAAQVPALFESLSGMSMTELLSKVRGIGDKGLRTDVLPPANGGPK